MVSTYCLFFKLLAIDSLNFRQTYNQWYLLKRKPLVINLLEMVITSNGNCLYIIIKITPRYQSLESQDN